LDELELETSNVQIADLFQDVIEIVQTSNDLKARDLLLITPSAPWPLPVIEGDPDLLIFLIHNPVENSVKFSSPTDTIEVRASDESGYGSI
jgi:two-component system, OmpR family, sensor kinase